MAMAKLKLTMPKPVLLLMPQHDKIVPPAAAAARADALPNATAIKVASGHVAMIVGRQAKAQSWEPLADWLDGLAPAKPKRHAPTKRKMASTKKLSVKAKKASAEKSPGKKAATKAKPRTKAKAAKAKSAKKRRS